MIRRRGIVAVLALLAIGLFQRRSEADLVLGTYSSHVFAYNTSTGMTTTFLSGLSTATGIAYGPDGNLDISERSGGTNSYFIEKYSLTGQDLGMFASGLSSSFRGIGLAFDSSGDLFATESGLVHEFYAGGGGRDLAAPSGGSFLPYQLTVSSSGNLYVTDSGTNNIYQYNAATGALSSTPFATISGGGQGVYVNSSGDVFISSGSGIHEYNPAGTEILNGSSPFSTQSGSGLAYSAGANSLFEVNPPSLDSINPTSGSSSSVSGGFTSVEYLTVAPAAVPEPSSLILLACGGLGVAVATRARRGWMARG